MAQVEVKLPKMGESVAEATITTWLKQVGDTVEAEESIVEIATDKVDSEVPSPADGVITQVFFEEGDVPQVGDIIAIISSEGEGAAPVTVQKAATPTTPSTNAVNETTPSTSIATVTNADFANSDNFYSPLVKNIAKEEGISVQELEGISGTGANNRVTKNDILGYISSGRPTSPPASVTTAPTSVPKPSVKPTPAGAPKPSDFSGNVEIIEMDRMRKLISKHMVNSKQTSPHVTSFVEADVTNIVNWRNKMKSKFFEREGEKLTFTPIIMEAIVKAIKDFPLVNVEVQGDYIIKKNDINLGMATALPSGNLIVPVIHNADNYNLTGLAKKVNSLAAKARNNKLTPDDIAGGTYTMTNVGTFGNVMGTPVINQPQVAIMAVGAIRKMPSVIETKDGDFIGIRHKMFLSHAYDHRVVDGALGGMFVRKVADYLESFDINREL
ncbi:MAG: 2-oxoglutarate dehydrogenase E2 component (dihydrolipoamide succinyltransferase) [Salibacteraceae bacterium]|jgi:2-oxoglutarate dehydrogenase E2 component (dihydrolipoamide succinyltransferase)